MLPLALGLFIVENVFGGDEDNGAQGPLSFSPFSSSDS